MESYSPPPLQCFCSSSRCWSPGPLRHPPVDAFQQITELPRHNHDGSIGRRTPYEASPLQLLRGQAGSLAIMPDDLSSHRHDRGRRTDARTSDRASASIAPSATDRESLCACPYGRRQPDLHTSRNWDHRRPSTQSRMRPSASVSMSLSTRRRRQRPSSIITSLRFRQGCGLNCPPFRPDSRHKQKGSSTGLRTGLCLTSIDTLNC